MGTLSKMSRPGERRWDRKAIPGAFGQHIRRETPIARLIAKLGTAGLKARRGCLNRFPARAVAELYEKGRARK